MRALFLCIGMLAASSQASASTIMTVYVTGMRIDSTVLCEGSGCSGLFSSPSIQYDVDVSVLSDLASGAEQDPQAQCDDDSLIRETAAWAAYKAAMTIRYPAYAQRAKADEENWGRTISITFSNGSVGSYYRMDSSLNSTHGLTETKAPNCKA